MDIVYATANAVIPLPDGGRVTVRAGTHWPATDPVVALQPTLFSTDPRYGLNYTADPEEARWEEATATPGERRGNRPVPAPPGGRRG